MATISKTLSPSSREAGLRPFNLRRDLGPVADLVELCFADTLDADGRLYLQRMRAASQHPEMLWWMPKLSGNIPLTGYVWQQDRRVVGNVSLIHYGLIHRHYLIANVAVHPEYRRQGIARKMTLQAIEHARQRRASSVWLHVREDNPAAVGLYCSMGFVERTRRTTWFSKPQATPMLAAPIPAGVSADRLQVVPARSVHWASVRRWLQRSYPPEFSWHLPLKTSLLEPGVKGFFLRLFYNAYVSQWAAVQDGRLVGSVAWQHNPPRANILWLAAPLTADHSMLSKLLITARQEIGSDRPLVLDYPAHQLEKAIQEAGFTPHQTLIWMHMSL